MYTRLAMIVAFLFFISLNAFSLVDSFDLSEQVGSRDMCAQEDPDFKDCPEHVKTRHYQAVKILTDATAWLSKPIHDLRKDPDVAQGMYDYFKINIKDPNQELKVREVLAQVERLKESISSIKYSCKAENRGIWCLSDPYAIVPPPKSRVVLCPSYFQLSPKYQLGVLLHEWCHFSGSNHIDYLPENYCDKSSELKSEVLVRSSDMYMLFLYSLGAEGEPLPCF